MQKGDAFAPPLYNPIYRSSGLDGRCIRTRPTGAAAARGLLLTFGSRFRRIGCGRRAERRRQPIDLDPLRRRFLGHRNFPADASAPRTLGRGCIVGDWRGSNLHLAGHSDHVDRRSLRGRHIDLPLELGFGQPLLGVALRALGTFRALLATAGFVARPLAAAILASIILTIAALALAITRFVLAALVVPAFTGTIIILATVILTALILTVIVLAWRVLPIFLAAIVCAVIPALVEAAIVAVTILVIEVGRRLITPGALLFKTGAAFAQHPEIMIRKLQIIFGHHPITLHLGIAGKALIFLVKLAGIATRPAVQAVATLRRVIGAVRRARPTAAATAAVLSIVDQLFAAFVTGGLSPLQIRANPGYSLCAPRCMDPGCARVHDHRMSVPPEGSASLWVR